MKINVTDFIDTKGMSEEEVKSVEALCACVNGAVDAQLKAYMNDEVKLEELRKELADAVKSVEELKKEGLKLIDKEAFEKKMDEIESHLLKLKASTELVGGAQTDSVEAQLRKQLDKYITTDSRGACVVNLKEACKAAPGNKLELNLVLKDAGNVTTANVTGVHLGVSVDPVISVDPRRESVIRKYANVAKTNSRSLIYAEYESGEGDAEWVAEGGLKPLMDAKLTEKTVTAAKVAIAAKFTEESLYDFPAFVSEVETELLNKLGLKEEQGILDGSGSDGEIKGIAGDIPGFALTGINSITNANEFDALVAAYTQIVSNSEMAYRPNLVLMNPIDYAKMQLSKDLNGNYLRPFRYGDELILGLRVETTTSIEKGEFFMGDFGYLNIRDLWEVGLTMGWENDDFRKNIVTVIAEKRLMAYVKSQYKTAFVKDTFDTVIEEISGSGSDLDENPLG